MELESVAVLAELAGWAGYEVLKSVVVILGFFVRKCLLSPDIFGCRCPFPYQHDDISLGCR